MHTARGFVDHEEVGFCTLKAFPNLQKVTVSSPIACKISGEHIAFSKLTSLQIEPHALYEGVGNGVKNGVTAVTPHFAQLLSRQHSRLVSAMLCAASSALLQASHSWS